MRIQIISEPRILHNNTKFSILLMMRQSVIVSALKMIDLEMISLMSEFSVLASIFSKTRSKMDTPSFKKDHIIQIPTLQMLQKPGNNSPKWRLNSPKNDIEKNFIAEHDTFMNIVTFSKSEANSPYLKNLLFSVLTFEFSKK